MLKHVLGLCFHCVIFWVIEIYQNIIFFINSSNLMGSEWVLMHYFYNFTIYTHVTHSKKFQKLKNDVFVNVFVTHDWWWTFWHSFIYLIISMFSMKIMILRVDQIMWWCDSKNMFLMSNFIKTLWKLIFQWFSSVFIKIWSKLHQKTILNDSKRSKWSLCIISKSLFWCNSSIFWSWGTLEDPMSTQGTFRTQNATN